MQQIQLDISLVLAQIRSHIQSTKKRKSLSTLQIDEAILIGQDIQARLNEKRRHLRRYRNLLLQEKNATNDIMHPIDDMLKTLCNMRVLVTCNIINLEESR
jgi:hypothetical protein